MARRQSLTGEREPPGPSGTEGLRRLLSSILGGPAGILETGGLEGEWKPEYLSREQPVLESMIPTAKNLDRFQTFKTALYEALLRKGADPSLAEALSYFGLRYPRRMKTVDWLEESKLPKGTPARMDQSKVLPSFRGDIWVDLKQHDTVNEVVNSLGHETQHTVDLLRRGVNFLDDKRKLYDNPRASYEEYRYKIPSETRAFNAGETAESSYQKYVELLKAVLGAQNQP